ncbi:MAG TPA: serine hydrolase [Gemmatimonadales bacterium]|nr:serine hydrolase [Gemmatimonadales bacterium]
MKRVLPGLLAVLATATAAGAQQGSREPFPGLDAWITRAMAEWKVPGLALAVVRNDSVLYTRGYGVKLVGTTDVVDDRTLFEIGSSSKSFTATLVAMLVTDGKMRWDDKIAAFLPDFRLNDPVASAELTVRDALTHRSGLSRGDLSWMAAGVTRDEVLHRIRFLRPSAPFRSRWSYQNVMFLAAGQAAARAAGSTWDDLVSQRIFVPLGMTASIAVLHEPDKVANLATPHSILADTVRPKAHMNIDDMAPAGSIVSNALDMAQYLRFQLGDGQFAGKRLVGKAQLRETHTAQMLTGAGSPTDSLTRFNAYGMGWFVEDYRQALVWQHGGNTDGMTTAMGVMPEQKFGVVVLSNMHGAALPAIIMRYLFDRQLGAPLRDLSAETLARAAIQRRRADSVEKAQAAQHIAGAKPPAALSAYTGTYTDSLYGEAVVSAEGDRLTMKRGEWNAPLEFWNGNNFRWGPLQSAAVTNLFVKFDTNPDGKVGSLMFLVGADTVSMGRKPTTPAAARAP